MIERYMWSYVFHFIPESSRRIPHQIDIDLMWVLLGGESNLITFEVD